MGTIQPLSRPECLYIIGNGFDLHYGIKSSYLDYLAYLNEHDSALSGLLEEVCPGDIWKNFESALGALAPGSLFTNTFNLIIPDSDSEYEWEQRSASWNYHLQAMEKTQPEKDSGTFSAWVSKIDTAGRAHDDGLIENTSDAVYLTFNYTKILEDRLGIDQERILHIHGTAGESDLVFVHSPVSCGASSSWPQRSPPASSSFFTGSDSMRSHPFEK